MAGSSSTMAIRRCMAGEYSPWRAPPNALPRDRHNCSPLCPHAAAPQSPSGSSMPCRTTQGSRPMEIRRQASTWYDVLSFLSLAAVLGLASGVALGAVALLLAAPAYGADSEEIKEGTLLLRRQSAADAASEEQIQAP